MSNQNPGDATASGELRTLRLEDLDATRLRPRGHELAEDLGSPIRSRDGSVPVRVRGERPSKVLMRGRQWAVTTYGIEALDGQYTIERKRLGELYPGWSWLVQLGLKSWVDADDFAVVYCCALVMHGYCPSVPSLDALLGKPTKAKARKRERERASEES